MDRASSRRGNSGRSTAKHHSYDFIHGRLGDDISGRACAAAAQMAARTLSSRARSRTKDFQRKIGIRTEVSQAERTKDVASTILEAIQTVLTRRGASGLTVSPASKLTADLEFDSLELAEPSSILEDDLGRDPYSEGIVPETVAE